MLLHVAVLFGGYRSQRAEQAVRFAVGAGREEQCRGRTAGGAVSEGQRPQSINAQNRIVRILDQADELAREAVVGRDRAAAEIAHEYRIAEQTEVARRPDDSPRGIQPGPGGERADVPARGVVQLDKAKASPRHIIVPGTVLQGVGDEEGATDV